MLAKKEPIVEDIHIKFSEVPSWVAKKEKEIEKEENELFFSIKHRMKDLVSELDKQLVSLDSVDLTKKKVEDKIKVVVRGNARTYAQHVSRLKDHIDTHDANELSTLSKDLDKKIVEFDKKTRVNYQKATYLIGKEMADIQKSIGEFYNHLRKQLDVNKHIIDSVSVIDSVRSLLKEVEVVDIVLKEINIEIKNIDKKKKKLVSEQKEKKKDIEKIKKSDSYLSNEQKKKDVVTKERDLSLNLQTLKSMIDFKRLANVFHSSPRKMKEVKAFKSSFGEMCEKDNSELLLRLLAETKLDSDDIKAAIANINKNRKKLDKLRGSISSDKTQVIISEIESLGAEMTLCDERNNKEMKRKTKEESGREDLVADISKDLKNIHVIVKNDKR